MSENSLLNKKRWNEIATHHFHSDYYSTKRFIEDKDFSTLSVIEQQEIGTIAGKSLLHLQCHIGTDTLSLARLGADVTGIDFSETSIEYARQLAKESGTHGDFIVSDLYELPQKIATKFDIVYSNWGALQWLPDLEGWAKIVSGSLNQGGMFYMAELHPFGLVCSRRERVPEWRYFPDKDNTPVHFSNNRSYANAKAELENPSFCQWPHTLSDIVSKLVQNGLALEFVHEHPESVYQQTPEMVQQENGLFTDPIHNNKVPFSFSVKAFKPN